MRDKHMIIRWTSLVVREPQVKTAMRNHSGLDYRLTSQVWVRLLETWTSQDVCKNTSRTTPLKNEWKIDIIWPLFSRTDFFFFGLWEWRDIWQWIPKRTQDKFIDSWRHLILSRINRLPFGMQRITYKEKLWRQKAITLGSQKLMRWCRNMPLWTPCSEEVGCESRGKTSSITNARVQPTGILAALMHTARFAA